MSIDEKTPVSAKPHSREVSTAKHPPGCQRPRHKGKQTDDDLFSLHILETQHHSGVAAHLEFAVSLVQSPRADGPDTLLVLIRAMAVPLTSVELPNIGRTVAISHTALSVRLVVSEAAVEGVLQEHRVAERTSGKD